MLADSRDTKNLKGHHRRLMRLHPNSIPPTASYSEKDSNKVGE